jgi:soluble lytic murein transglycosylase-like protein
MIAAAAVRFDVSQTWIAQVMTQESGGRTTLNGAPITSNKGAMGLMQIMPATYAELRQRYGFGRDAYDPHDNIFAGAAYLHELYQRYGYPNLFAAYNAGPARLDDYLTRGRPLPEVTTAYVRAVTSAGYPHRQASNPVSATASAQAANPLFFVNHTSESNAVDAPAPPSLFATLSPPQR